MIRQGPTQNRSAVKTRIADHTGASAVEYAIMVALIAVVVIAAVAFVGLSLKSDFDCAGSWVGEMPDDPGCST